MGGRGGGGAASRERMQADFDALQQHQGQLGPEQQVQKAIQQLVTEQGKEARPDMAWVNIADLRDRLPGMSHDEFDRLIRSMSIGSHAVLHIVPEENQKTLTKRQRAAAIMVGGEPNHHVRLRRQ